MKIFWMRIVAIAACFLLVGSGAWASIASAEASVRPKDGRPVDLRELLPEEIQDQDPKMGASLEAAIEIRPGEDLEIIIMMQEQPGLNEKDRFNVDQAKSLASATQAPLLELLRELEAENITPHWIVNAISTNVLAERIAEIAAHPDVGMIWLDEPIRPPELIPSLPDFGGSMIGIYGYLRNHEMSSKETLSAAAPGTGTISGRVTDEDGAGVAMAIVSARDAVTGASGFALTDAAGNYIITDLMPGIYRVGFSSHPMVPPPLMADTLWRLEVVAGKVTTADITLENIVPDEVGVISGRVTDTHGLAVADALVVASDFETGILGLAWTNAGGSYSIANLPQATYVIEVMPPALVEIAMSRIFDVDVNEGETTTLDVTLVNIVPGQVGTIAGWVTDEAGVGVVGATVILTDEKTGVFALTETTADGSFAVPDLPQGMYRLVISPMPEFSPKLRMVMSIICDLWVFADETTVMDVTLYRDYGDDFIEAPGMWNKGFDGGGIRIAILDTGICRHHPDLDGGKVISERDFTVWDRFIVEELTQAETNDYSIILRDARDLEVYLRWEDPANDLELLIIDPDGYKHVGIDIGNYRRVLIPGPVMDGEWIVNVEGTTVRGTESYSLKIGFDSAWDDHKIGHGTHVAGIAAGAYNPETGITGVAPGAYLLNAKVFNVDGDTRTSWLISAVEWSVEEAADVINLSLGSWQGDGSGRALLDMAVTHAAGAGHIMVTSAGNWGPDESTIGSPAVAHRTIAVAASNTVDEIVFFSSRGPTGDGRVGIDLAAPGLGVIAPVPLWLHPTGYADWPGTSMSAPHVAGAAALLLQAFPNLTPAEMERALKNSAEDLFFGILEQGAGRLNVTAAYLALREGILVDHEWSVGRVLPGVHTKTFTVENRAAEAKALPIDWSVMIDTQDYLAGDWINAPRAVTIPAGGIATFTATMTIPAHAAAGTYAGHITLGEILIPVSVNLIQPVAPGTRIDITGTVDEDWDFIHYTLDVEPGTTALWLTLDWTDEVNDLDIFLFNPQGDLAATSFWDYPEAISISHPTPGQWTVAIMAWWLAIPETYTLQVHSPDVIPPSIAITSTAVDPTNISPIPMTATFSEDVTAFELGDVTVGNGTAANFFEVSGREFTFDVTPDADGVVTVDIAAGVAHDAAGNPNEAAPRFSMTYNTTAPTVAIASTAADPTNVSPIPVTVTFNEDVTGFELGDITVRNGTAGNFVVVSGRKYTFEVIPDAAGVVAVDIPAGVARDAAGNDNIAAPEFSITYNPVAPTVAVTSPAANPTNISPIPVTATFSQDVTGFELGDVTVGNGTAVNFVAVSGREFTFDVTPDADGVVTVDIAAGAARDAAGNYNIAAPQFRIAYDTIAPTVAITSIAADPTNISPIPVTATFSQDVTGFELDDITVGNGTAGNFVEVSGREFTFDVTPDADDMVTVAVAVDVARDAAGNYNIAAAQFSIAYDTIAPTVAITSIAADPTNISPIPVTATFSQDVTGFELGDVTVGNGTAGNFVAVSGREFTFDVTPDADGVVTIDIADGVARDAAGNYNTAAPQFSMTYDGTAPTVISISPAADAAGVPIDTNISVTFSEKMDGTLAEGAFSIEPAVAGTFTWVENTMTFDPEVDLEYGTTYNITISTRAKDLAGNPLAADYTWSFTTVRAPLNWALIGGIIGAVVVIVGLLVYFLMIRKKGKQAGVRGVEPP